MDYRALQRIAIFASLTGEHLRQIATIASEERYKYNEYIFREGDRGDRFYLIASGKVRISREVAGMGEEALAILKDGDYFGEMSLIDDFPRSADAKCHEPCVLHTIKREDMEELLFLNKDLAHELLWSFVRTLSARLRETNDKMTFLAVSGKFS
jgi:CRP-like cAMP-binding protein